MVAIVHHLYRILDLAYNRRTKLGCLRSPDWTLDKNAVRRVSQEGQIECEQLLYIG